MTFTYERNEQNKIKFLLLVFVILSHWEIRVRLNYVIEHERAKKLYKYIYINKNKNRF